MGCMRELVSNSWAHNKGQMTGSSEATIGFVDGNSTFT
jgi:hypothetical protein